MFTLLHEPLWKYQLHDAVLVKLKPWDVIGNPDATALELGVLQEFLDWFASELYVDPIRLPNIVAQQAMGTDISKVISGLTANLLLERNGFPPCIFQLQ